MNWTTQRPTEPGQYLCQWRDNGRKKDGGPFMRPFIDLPPFEGGSPHLEWWYYGPIPNLPEPTDPTPGGEV